MARSVSGDLWTDLYYLYFAIAAIVGALVVGWLFYNMWAFRWRPDRPRPADAPRAGVLPAERGHPLWSYVMAGLIALIMFGLAFGTISAVQTMEIPPEEGETVYHDVIGYQFGWKYNYTGVGGVPFQIVTPGTASFVVPVDTNVVLNVTSQDVWHNFAITDFRIRVDAIPGTVNPLWFRAHETGSFVNVCVVICGVNHAKMHAPMLVVTDAEYRRFLEEQSDKAFDRLQGQIEKSPARGTIVNVTATETTLDLETVEVLAGKPVVFNITHVGAETITVHAGGNAVVVQPQGDARLFALAPEEGRLEISTGAATRTLEVAQG